MLRHLRMLNLFALLTSCYLEQLSSTYKTHLNFEQFLCL